MNTLEYYHDWLRDAHAMARQAISMLASTIGRIDNYPELQNRLIQHLAETKRQLGELNHLIEQNDISRSVLKDAMSRQVAFGQTITGMFASDEIVKGVISSYVFEQFEIACYISLVAAADKANDPAGATTLRAILDEQRAMASWLLHHLPRITQQFLLLNGTPDVEVKSVDTKK